MTPKAKGALRWFAAHGPIGLFGADAPSDVMRRILEKRGLIERIPGGPGLSLVKFQISKLGREALS